MTAKHGKRRLRLLLLPRIEQMLPALYELYRTTGKLRQMQALVKQVVSFAWHTECAFSQLNGRQLIAFTFRLECLSQRFHERGNGFKRTIVALVSSNHAPL